MRVPTREHRYFLSQSPQFGLRGRHDERIPRVSTPVAEDARRRDLAPEHRAQTTYTEDGPDYSDATPLLIPDSFALSARFSALLQEASWERILRKHGLADDA